MNLVGTCLTGLLLAMFHKVKFEPPFSFSNLGVKYVDVGAFEHPIIGASDSALFSSHLTPLPIARSISPPPLAHSDHIRALKVAYGAILRPNLGVHIASWDTTR